MTEQQPPTTITLEMSFAEYGMLLITLDDLVKQFIDRAAEETRDGHLIAAKTVMRDANRIGRVAEQLKKRLTNPDPKLQLANGHDHRSLSSLAWLRALVSGAGPPLPEEKRQ